MSSWHFFQYIFSLIFNFKSHLVLNILAVLSCSYLNSPGTSEELFPAGVRGSFHARLPYNSPVTAPPLLVYLPGINVMPPSWYRGRWKPSPKFLCISIIPCARQRTGPRWRQHTEAGARALQSDCGVVWKNIAPKQGFLTIGLSGYQHSCRSILSSALDNLHMQVESIPHLCTLTPIP